MKTTLRTAAWVSPLLLGLALVSTGARADATPTPPPRRVWLEARPWTCARELPAFAVNVELACDAMGHECEVAPSQEVATETATLYCHADATDRWSVEVGPQGERIVASLTGDREQRLRKAAMWVARANLDGSPPPTPAPAPAPAPAPEATPPVVIVVPALAGPAPHDTSDAPTTTPTNHGGITLSSLSGVTSAATGVAGLHAHFAVPLPHGFYVGPSASYVSFYQVDWSDLARGPGSTTGQGVLGGVQGGWGAPFDDHWVGGSVGVGGGGEWNNSGPVVTPTAYGRVAFTVQVPIFRPRAWASEIASPVASAKWGNHPAPPAALMASSMGR